MKQIADVKWIKLSTMLFDNRKIKQIECLPDGDSIIVIWVKLLCLAGNINDSGFVYFTKEIPYTDQMLATQFGRPLTTVQLALRTFEQFEMVEIIDNILHISNWEKYQSVDKLAEIREQNRIRQKNWYDRQKQKVLAEPNVSVTLDVTLPNATDKDKERDKELYINIVEYFNKKANTNYKATTKKTQSLIHARLAEGFTEDDFKKVIDNKCAEWIGTEWQKYLRPETLFGTKFEGYLNTKKTVNNGLDLTDDPLDGLPF